jgi:nucleolar MIF4G domain-containing protein 1
MARNEDEEPHGIRLPPHLLEQIETKNDKGDYDDEDDSRFTKFATPVNGKKRKEVSRKEKRQEERKSKKQKKATAKKQYITKEAKQTKVLSKKPPTKRVIVPVKDKIQEDPLTALKALKAKMATKSMELKIVKEDDLDDDDEMSDFGSDFDEQFEGEDFDDEEMSDLDDFEGFDDDDENTEDDPIAKLKALKEAKKNQDPLAQLKALKEAKKQAEDPLAQLKALKEAKASKNEKKDSKKDKKDKKDSKKKEVEETSRILAPQERESMRRDEEDMKFYAKKLGLKSGKTKLSKTEDDDVIGGLLDGLDLDFGDDFVNDDIEEGVEPSDFEDEDDDAESGFDNDSENDFDDSDTSEVEKENPYIAPVPKSKDSQKNSEEGAATKYIPPALRRKLALENSDVTEEILSLRKSIKGPLNRLSEANVATIVNEINGLFLNNARHSVNNELTAIILDSILQQGRLLDTFVHLHATLVSAIYRLQGVEFGAYFIQTLVEKLESFLKLSSSGKEASNLISLLSSIYLLSLVSSKLLYDVIRVLINDLNEVNADLLLRLVRITGNQMRSDDPAALKEIVLLINNVYASLPSDKINTRTQFLIETITSLKNNKLKVNNEATHQLTIRLKKFLGGINNNKLSDPIQVSLEDIHNIESRGKWWLVGSAWKGHENNPEATSNANQVMIDDILDNAEPNWMELARAQRMNTDIRRAIFISIMSANDYIDAVTKLDKLALKRSQEREIPRVLIHCTGVEPAWNPYYGILANKLCDNHSYRKTFQFMLWDLIKDLEGTDGNESDDDGFLGFDDNSEDDDSKLKRILNLGRFFGFLLAEGSLPLHILRTINFFTASNDTMLFTEVLFVTFLDQVGKKSQINSVGAGLSKKAAKMYDQKFDDKILIERTMKAQEQPTLLKGIQYFLEEKVVSSTIISGRKQKKRIEWGVKALGDIIDELLKSKD